MARRRFQEGYIRPRGETWELRWREDELQPDGTINRINKARTLRRKDFPTERLARRELQRQLAMAGVNNLDYSAKPVIRFKEFADRWATLILPNHKPSTQASERSILKQHLLPRLGTLLLKNVSTETVQSLIVSLKCSAKTTRNCVALLRSLWHYAVSWGLVDHDPFKNVLLPRRVRAEPRFFTVEEIRRIIDAAEEPYKTFYMLAAETGMRAGELCGLRWEDVNLENGIVQVRQSAWRGKVGTPKSSAGRRTFSISRQLTALLVERKRTDGSGLLFHASTGSPWDGNLVVKRKLRPLLSKLRIEIAGLHAFRHANATMMDQANTPEAVRQARLGHSEFSTTMGYTHRIGADDRLIAEKIAEILHASERNPEITKAYADA